MRFLGDLSASDVQAAAGALLTLVQGGVDQATHAEVSAFQTAYNGNGGSPAIAVDGQYGPCTMAALQAVLNAGPNQPPQAAPASAFPGACSNGTYVAPSGGGGGSPGGGGVVNVPPTTIVGSGSALPTWAKWVLGAVAVLAVGAIWWMLKHHKGGRIRRRPMRHHARETPSIKRRTVKRRRR